MSADIEQIAEGTGRIPADWQSRLPQSSSPYTSTIVFLVCEGNPRGIEDWDDLVADGVQVITPNPKTSGGVRWNFLAAWAYSERNGLDPAKFVGALYRDVPLLDTGARGSTTTFTQRGIGDVLLARENEAFLAFDIVVPSVSILAEPPETLVDGNITSDAQRAAAEAYLQHLYSPEPQALALSHYYRAWDTSMAAPEDAARFPELELVTIADFGGWPVVQPEYFGEGAGPARNPRPHRPHHGLRDPRSGGSDGIRRPRRRHVDGPHRKSGQTRRNPREPCKQLRAGLHRGLRQCDWDLEES